MLRSSLIFVATLVAGAGAVHAQVDGDPQAVAPAVYSGTPNVSADCAGNGFVDAQDPACVPGESGPTGEPANGDYPPDYDYAPDYWEAAPAYVAPSFYLGVSVPPVYWAWPWYGYYGWGWPYYYGYAAIGFGWPYYGYCCYWGGYWNSYAWHDHGHHDHGGWDGHGGHGDHGHWDGHGGGDHAGHGSNGYPGPYRYLGRGQYANQIPGSGGRTGAQGDRPTRVAGAAPAPANQAGLARIGAAPNTGSTFADVRGAARTAAFTSNPGAGQGRFAGRAALPSASYVATARAAGNAAFAGNRVATSFRENTAAGYANGRGTATNAANQNYRTTGLPSRSYASANYAGGRQTMMRSGANVAPRSYAGRVAPSYPQQRYAPSNHSYMRGSAPPYSAVRGTMPSYTYSGRGSMPSYARGGSYSTPHASHGGASAPHGGGSMQGGGSAHGGSHATTSRGR